MSLGRQFLALVFLTVAGALAYTLYAERLSDRPAEASVGGPGAGGPGAGRGGGPGGGGPRPVAVEIATAQEAVLMRTVEAVGTVRALRSVDVVPLAEGRLVAVEIEPGRQVAEGEVIARLDAGIEDATLAEAEAALADDDSALARLERLSRSNSGTVSDAALDTARAERAMAAAALERARRRLEDRTVRAPFAGVLGIRQVDTGARVETDTVLTTLDDLSAVEVEFTLPETVYAEIAPGQPVRAKAAAFPGRTFAGTVASVDTRVDPVSRAFRVRARLPNEDRALPAGMFMRLEIDLADRRAVLAPEEALLFAAGQPQLFVVEDEAALARTVRLGLRRAGEVEIVEGLDAGETVVTRGIQSLRPGAPVRIVGRTDEAPDPPSAPPDGPEAADAAPSAERDA